MTIVKEQGATRRLGPRDFMSPGAPNKDNRRNKRKHPLPGEYRPNPKAPGRKRDRYPPKPKPGDRDYVPRKPRPNVSPKPINPAPQPGRSLKHLQRRINRRLPGMLLRRIPALMLVEEISPLLWPNPWPVPNPLNGWVKCWGDCVSVVPNHSSTTASCNNPALYLCLGGQALGVANGIQPPLDSATRYTLSWGRQVTAGWRHTLHSMWGRPSAVPQAQPLQVPSDRMGYGISPMPDPNLMRNAPSLPKFDIGFGTPFQPDILTGDDVLDRLSNMPWRSTIINADSGPIGLPSVSPGLAPKPGASGQPLPPSRPTKPSEPPVDPVKVGAPAKPHIRAKPPRNTKEIKPRGPIYYGFLIADRISEGAEVVDALFEALPKDVQKRWDCNRSVAFIDKAGQYGIDNADCKARAVFHNSHLIDGADAIRNIIANMTEDQLIGALHKRLPRNLINASEDGQRAYADIVQRVLQELGLK